MTNFIAFAYPATGQTIRRTSPDRWADWKNINDFGTSADWASAFEAALNSQGLIYVPAGSYTLNRAVRLPYTDGSSGESYKLFGHEAYITGNFPDFLFRRPRGNDNYQPKEIQGFTFLNAHAAGGVINFENSSNSFVRDCTLNIQNIGCVWSRCKGPAGCFHCKGNTYDSTNNLNMQCIAMDARGGVISGVDTQGIGKATSMSGGGSVSLGGRWEVSDYGISLLPPEFQTIMSTGTSPTGAGWTRLTLTHTLLLQTGDTIVIGDWSKKTTPNIAGTWTVTWVDATHIDIPCSYSAEILHTMNGGEPTVYLAFAGYTLGGTVIMSEENEANGYSVFAPLGLSSTYICSLNAQLHNEPRGTVGGGTYYGLNWNSICKAAIWLGDGSSGFVLKALSASTSGGIQYGTVYYGGDGSSPPVNYDVAANALGGRPCCVASTITTGTSTIPLYDGIPRWLVPGLKPVPQAGIATVPNGTTVLSVSSSPPQMVLSNPITGMMTAEYDGFDFYDSGGNPVGLLSLT